MWLQRLNSLGGEFACPEREAAFQADRLPETLRHARHLLLFSAVLNTLFLISDWRFAGHMQFWVAVPARFGIIATSLLCLAACRRVASFRGLQRILITGEAVTAVMVGMQCTTHSDLALAVTLILPPIYLIAVPTSFVWTLVSTIGCMVVVTTGYFAAVPITGTFFGLILAIVAVNGTMILFVIRWNRLRRVEWSIDLAQARTHDELAEHRVLIETTFRAVPVPVVVSRLSDGVIVNANDAAIAFFEGDLLSETGRYRTADLVGRTERRQVQALIAEGTLVRDVEIVVNTLAGARRDILLSGEPVTADGAACVIWSLVDITSRKAVEERIRVAANHDVLTGLPNRALFQVTLDAGIGAASASETSVGLILIDLDAFKEVNDTLGHEAGDTLLKDVARRLEGAVGRDGLVARLGGDEFVVIARLQDRGPASHRHIDRLAEAILDALRPSTSIAGRTVVPRASLGLAIFPEQAATATDLFTNADLALYAAKAGGRNRATLFRAALRASIEQRVALDREVRIALDAGGIIPFYQPKVALGSGAVVGFEALARWQHPTRGLLAPAAFASAFDDPELGIAVGRAVMDAVFGDVAGWIARGLEPGRVFLNLSSAQFAEADLAEKLLAALRGAGLGCGHIGIEVTETVLLGGHGDRVSPVLETLHAAGISVALDDFGTGYASLTHLKQYPVDEIKIDRSFVRDLERDTDDAAIVAAVLQLGASLGLDVTAEGVETVEQARFLNDRRCAYAQGYLYSKPMPASRVPWFLENRPDLVSAYDSTLVLRQA